MAKVQRSKASPRPPAEFAKAILGSSRACYFRKSDIVALFPGVAPSVASAGSNGCTVFVRSGAAIVVQSSAEEILMQT
jgi:hypothetical protein